MNALRYLTGFLATVMLFALTGCYGPAPGLDPTISFSFPAGTQLPFLPAHSVLVIDGKAEVADEQGNPIVDIVWTQDPAIGVFSSTRTLGTSWRVRPELVQTITAPVDVTLTVTATTLQQGRRAVPINLVIMPPGTGALDPVVTLSFPGDPVLTSFPVTNTLGIEGTATVTDPVANPITSVTWLDLSGLGSFSSTNTVNTSWQVVNPAAVTQPTDVMLLVIVETLLGGQSIVPVHLTVEPASP